MSAHKVQLYGYATSPFVVKVGAFLKYKQIPFGFVIDGEWRADSTPLGVWLEEVFPEHPILGRTPQDTDHILEIDRWVTDQLLMGLFRQAMEWENARDAIKNGWTLARIIHDSMPIPFFVRVGWPFIVQRVGFVRRFGNRVDRSEPLPEMRDRQRRELLHHLGNGPFLGSRNRASLADLSAYTAIVTSHLIGMQRGSNLLEDPDVLAWCRRVQTHLPANPLVVPDHLLKRELP